MISRKDVWVLGAFVLVAAVAGLACYVVMDLTRPEGVAVATPPAQLVTATFTGLSGTAVAPAPAPSPTPVPQFGSIVFGLGTDGQQVLYPSTAFPADTKDVYAAWSYQSMAEGMLYHVSRVLLQAPGSAYRARRSTSLTTPLTRSSL